MAAVPSRAEVLDVTDKMTYSQRIAYAVDLGRTHKDSTKLSGLIKELRTHEPASCPTVTLAPGFAELLPPPARSTAPHFHEHQVALVAAVTSGANVPVLREELAHACVTFDNLVAGPVAAACEDEELVELVIRALPGVRKKLLAHCLKQRKNVVVEAVFKRLMESAGKEAASPILHGCSSAVVAKELPALTKFPVRWKQLSRYHPDAVLAAMAGELKAAADAAEVCSVWKDWSKRLRSSTTDLYNRSCKVGDVWDLYEKFPTGNQKEDRLVYTFPALIEKHFKLFATHRKAQVAKWMLDSVVVDQEGVVSCLCSPAMLHHRRGALRSLGTEDVENILKAVAAAYTPQGFYADRGATAYRNLLCARLRSLGSSEVQAACEGALALVMKFEPTAEFLKKNTGMDAGMAWSTWSTAATSVVNAGAEALNALHKRALGGKLMIHNPNEKAAAASLACLEAVAERGVELLAAHGGLASLAGSELKKRAVALASLYSSFQSTVVLGDGRRAKIAMSLFEGFVVPFVGLTDKAPLPRDDVRSSAVSLAAELLRSDPASSPDSKTVSEWLVARCADDAMVNASRLAPMLPSLHPDVAATAMYVLSPGQLAALGQSDEYAGVLPALVEATLVVLRSPTRRPSNMDEASEKYGECVTALISETSGLPLQARDDLLRFQDIRIGKVRNVMLKATDANAEVERQFHIKAIILASLQSGVPLETTRTLRFVVKKIKNDKVSARAFALRTFREALDLYRVGTGFADEDGHRKLFLQADALPLWSEILTDCLESQDLDKPVEEELPEVYDFGFGYDSIVPGANPTAHADKKYVPPTDEHPVLKHLQEVAYDALEEAVVTSDEALFDFGVDIQWRIALHRMGEKDTFKKFRIRTRDPNYRTLLPPVDQTSVARCQVLRIRMAQMLLDAYGRRVAERVPDFLSKGDYLAGSLRLAGKSYKQVPALVEGLEKLLASVDAVEKDDEGVLKVDGMDDVVVLFDVLCYIYGNKWHKQPILVHYVDKMMRTWQAPRFLAQWLQGKAMVYKKLNVRGRYEARAQAVEELLAISPSAIHRRFVWRFLVRHRQDLLDAFLASPGSYRGLFYLEPAARGPLPQPSRKRAAFEVVFLPPLVAGKKTLKQRAKDEEKMKEAMEKKSRSVHPDFFYLEACYALQRLLPRQLRLMEEVNAARSMDEDFGMRVRVSAAIRWTTSPSIRYSDVVDRLEKVEESAPVNVVEALIRGVMYGDEPCAPLQYLLSTKFLGSPRARVAIYCIQRCVPYMQPAVLTGIVRQVLEDPAQRSLMKTTTHKEVVRLLASTPTAAHIALMHNEWKQKLHPDVRTAIVRSAIKLLGTPSATSTAQQILSTVMEKGSNTVMLLTYLGAVPESARAPPSFIGLVVKSRMLKPLAKLSNARIPAFYEQKWYETVILPLAQHPNADIATIARASLIMYKDQYSRSAPLIGEYVKAYAVTTNLKEAKANRECWRRAVKDMLVMCGMSHKPLPPASPATDDVVVDVAEALVARARAATSAERAGMFACIDRLVASVGHLHYTHRCLSPIRAHGMFWDSLATLNAYGLRTAVRTPAFHSLSMAALKEALAHHAEHPYTISQMPHAAPRVVLTLLRNAPRESKEGAALLAAFLEYVLSSEVPEGMRRLARTPICVAAARYPAATETCVEELSRMVKEDLDRLATGDVWDSVEQAKALSSNIILLCNAANPLEYGQTALVSSTDVSPLTQRLGGDLLRQAVSSLDSDDSVAACAVAFHLQSSRADLLGAAAPELLALLLHRIIAAQARGGILPSGTARRGTVSGQATQHAEVACSHLLGACAEFLPPFVSQFVQDLCRFDLSACNPGAQAALDRVDAIAEPVYTRLVHGCALAAIGEQGVRLLQQAPAEGVAALQALVASSIRVAVGSVVHSKANGPLAPLIAGLKLALAGAAPGVVLDVARGALQCAGDAHVHCTREKAAQYFAGQVAYELLVHFGPKHAQPLTEALMTWPSEFVDVLDELCQHPHGGIRRDALAVVTDFPPGSQ